MVRHTGVAKRCSKSYIEELFLHPLSRERRRFLWHARMCGVLWGLWGERNNGVFRGLERSSSNV